MGLTMLPKNVGVARLRAFRNRWTHTRGHARATQEAQRAKRCKECVRIPTHITASLVSCLVVHHTHLASIFVLTAVWAQACGL